MILCISIENTYIRLGVYEKNGRLISTVRLSSERAGCGDEYTYVIKNLLELKQIDISGIEEAVISSVVPGLTQELYDAVVQLCGVRPMLLGPGMKTSLDIKVDNPGEIGTDIIANSVAAISKYTAPLIIFDFATATTVTVINEKNQLCDVYIAPGLKSSADALARDAAGLPVAALTAPRTLSGKNTMNSMKCGIMYSAAFILEGFATHIGTQLKSKNARLIATGQFAQEIIPLVSLNVSYEENLVLDGLFNIYCKNKKTGR